MPIDPATIRNRLLRSLPASELEQLLPQMRRVDMSLGDVLIRWNLHAGFAAEFPDPAMLRAYLDRIGFDDWNRTHDGGRPWAEGVAALRARWGPDAEPASPFGCVPPLLPVTGLPAASSRSRRRTCSAPWLCPASTIGLPGGTLARK